MLQLRTMKGNKTMIVVIHTTDSGNMEVWHGFETIIEAEQWINSRQPGSYEVIRSFKYDG